MDTRIRIESTRCLRNRCFLNISSLSEPLILPRELAEKHRLKEGTCITKAQLEELRAEAELALCDCEISRLLAMREHSVGEVKTKLTRKQFSSQAIHQTLRKYQKQGLLNDARYSQVFATRLLEANPCGRSYLIASLRRKLIDRSLAEKTVDLLLAGRDEVTLAQAALEKRWARFGQFELETARRKAYNYLSRRGIGYAAAKAAFETLYRDKKESDDDQNI